MAKWPIVCVATFRIVRFAKRYDHRTWSCITRVYNGPRASSIPSWSRLESVKSWSNLNGNYSYCVNGDDDRKSGMSKVISGVIEDRLRRTHACQSLPEDLWRETAANRMPVRIEPPIASESIMCNYMHQARRHARITLVRFSSPAAILETRVERELGDGMTNYNLGNERQSCTCPMETFSSAAVSLVRSRRTYVDSRDVYHQLQFSFASRVCLDDVWLSYVHFII